MMRTQLAMGLALVMVGITTCHAESDSAAERRVDYWKAVVFAPTGRDAEGHWRRDFERMAKEGLAPLGINTVILDMHWCNFRFTCRPEFSRVKLRKEREFTAEDLRWMAKTLKDCGIRPLVGMNFLTHQNSGQLLKAFPSLRWPKTPDLWDPLNPTTHEIALAMADELLDASGADGFHVGMDEAWGFDLRKFPPERVKGLTPAAVFAKCVREYVEHLVGKRKVEMLMWDDMFYMHGRGTYEALDMIPKDVVLCHWKYELQRDYPQIREYVSKGFRVLACPWKDPEAARAIARAALRVEDEKMLGILYTTWGANLLATVPGWDTKEMRPVSRGVAAVMEATAGYFRPGRQGDWEHRWLQKEIEVRKLLPALAEIEQAPRDASVIATLSIPRLTRQPPRLRGNQWITGIYPSSDPRAFLINFPRMTPSRPGDACLIGTSVKLPADTKDVHIRFFLADNFHITKWTEYRFYELLIDGNVVWSEDIAADRAGRRWTDVDVSKAVAGKDSVEVGLRVIDRRGVHDYSSLCVIGPLLLVRAPIQQSK